LSIIIVVVYTGWTFLGNEVEVTKITHRTLLEMMSSTYPECFSGAPCIGELKGLFKSSVQFEQSKIKHDFHYLSKVANHFLY
jgi:hypothetical protein